MALSGMSIVCVHMQFGPQSGGLLSPLQNCSGGISSICDRGGAGGDLYDISSIKLITWSPPGATKNNNDLKIYIKYKCLNQIFNSLCDIPRYLL